MEKQHHCIHITNKTDKQNIIDQIFSGNFLKQLQNLKGELYSEIALNNFLLEEQKHDLTRINSDSKKSLKHYSDGERKKLLLSYIIAQNPDFIIIDNVFDSLDSSTQKSITDTFKELSQTCIIIQLANRKNDALHFIQNHYSIDSNTIFTQAFNTNETVNNTLVEHLPFNSSVNDYETKQLVSFKNVNIEYEDIKIVKDICWEIKSNEFWQLIGPNGSGKSTLLSCITGDNPKAYGQDITLFGVKKGSGESIWEIKKQIGYFSTILTQGFSRQNTVEQMIQSGFFDSIGLYNMISESQVKLSLKWLKLIQLEDQKGKAFHSLSIGSQRLVLIARAMIKNPSLLILDEPTIGLDDFDTQLFCELINKIAAESQTTIIFVSHRKEKALKPKNIFELIPTTNGSIGKSISV